ncbi:MAG: hypothetical protein SPF56_00265 [Bacteroidaceae bacterium]|nr:hypothetical protein [Prevotellaceae bacterium]MDY5630935.1 hypothetical protein [Bacteroidaceae bacterium]
MKKTSILLISLLSVFTARAGNGDEHLNVSTGFLFPSTLVANVGFEHEYNYGNALEIYAELGNHWQSDPVDGKVYKDTFWKGYYWDGGALYKKSLRRYRNSILRARAGVQAGAYHHDFFMGAELGFEYNYVFQSGLVFSVIQKNQVNFFHGDTFRNGLLIGLKIPF